MLCRAEAFLERLNGKQPLEFNVTVRQSDYGKCFFFGEFYLSVFFWFYEGL